MERARLASIVLVFTVWFAPAVVGARPAKHGPNAPLARVPRVKGDKSLRFEEKPAGAGPGYRALGHGFILDVDAAGFTLGLPGRPSDGDSGVPVIQRAFRMDLPGADPNARAVPAERLPGVSHYGVGPDPAGWRSGVAGFGRIRYEGVWPGIDAIYRGTPGEMEYDFLVAPGARVKTIRLRFDTRDRLRIDRRGALVVRTPLGDVRYPRPRIYQEAGGRQREVKGGYVLLGPHEAGFRAGRHDERLPLIIDPVVRYLSYVGGAATEGGLAVAADADDNAYVAGTQQIALANPGKAAIWKYDPNGVLVWRAIIGGQSGDIARGVAVDLAGNVLIAGVTTSIGNTFNVTQGAYQTQCPKKNGATKCGFVVKFGPAGTFPPLYSTYVGGTGNDEAFAVATDDFSNAYVTGDAHSTDLRTNPNLDKTHAVQPACAAGMNGACDDAFVLKLDGAGARGVFLTYLGGSGVDTGRGIAARIHDHTVYVTGSTQSTDFPHTRGMKNSARTALLLGSQDAYFTMIDLPGDSLLYSTYLGGSDFDAGNAISVDDAGDAYLTGTTKSPDFPKEKSNLTRNGWMPGVTPLGGLDAFVARIDPTRSYTLDLMQNPPAVVDDPLVYSVVVGGAMDDEGLAIAVGKSNQLAWVTGHTTSTETQDLPQDKPGGGGDAFLASISSATDIYFSYAGGTADDRGNGVAVSESGVTYLAGTTLSKDLKMFLPPADPNRFQPYNGGGNDAFLVAFEPGVFPTVFIPGLLGSRIAERDTMKEVWPPGPVSRSVPDSLSRWADEDCDEENYVATDVLRGISFAIQVIDFYGDLLKSLVNDPQTGKVKNPEYRGTAKPAARTVAGCDIQQSPAPLIFPFPYDWRLDIDKIVDGLHEYVQCAQRYYPGAPVNIVAHSMGGLIARRYATRYPGDVHAVVTIGSPLLGTPKFYYVLMTGDIFGSPLNRFFRPVQDTFKHIAASLRGPVQLAPSSRYFSLGNALGLSRSAAAVNGPLADPWHALSPRSPANDFDFAWAKAAIDEYQHARNVDDDRPDWVEDPVENWLPGSIADAFHDVPQDDWSAPDMNRIRYYNIVGRVTNKDGTRRDSTIERVIARQITNCNKAGCQRVDAPDVRYGRGDGTVATLSSARRDDIMIGAKTPDLNKTPDDVFCINDVAGYAFSLSQGVDHATQLPRHPLTRGLIQELLFGGPATNLKRCEESYKRFSPGPDVPDVAPSWYVTFFGVRSLDASDLQGNDTRPDRNGDPGDVPGLDEEFPGDGVVRVVLPAPDQNDAYTLEAVATGAPAAVELYFGTGDHARQIIRYRDLDLASGARVRLVLAPQGPGPLLADPMGNGTFGTTITPTASASGPGADDLDGPLLDARGTVQPGGVLVTITASDAGSGVAAVSYSLDGTIYRPYAAPVVVDPSLHPVVYAFADDKNGNRSGTLTYTLPIVPVPDGGAGADLAMAFDGAMPADIGAVPPATSNGCGCRVGRSATSQGAGTLLPGCVLLAVALRRRRARSIRTGG